MASEVGRAAGSRRPLALTMGDPAGIGLDITLAAWRDRDRLHVPPFVLYADPRAVAERARLLGIAVDLSVSEDLAAGHQAFARSLPVRPVPLATPVVPGRSEMLNAGGIIAAIDLAVADAVAGRASAVATNPIAKSTLLKAGFRHPGHTEYLAELAERHHPGKRWVPVMMLASDILRVVRKLAPDLYAAATIHLVETSPTLRDVQRNTLQAHGGKAVWHESFDEIPSGFLLLAANEFFDAVPIRQFVKTQQGFRERLVGIDGDGKLTFVSGAGGLDPALLPSGHRAAPQGTIAEVAPARAAIMQLLADRLFNGGGTALVIALADALRARAGSA